MNKRAVLVVLAALSLSNITGCAAKIKKEEIIKEETEKEETVKKETVKEETAKETVSIEEAAEIKRLTKSNLKECFELIGKDDEEATYVLGGGKENIAADGTTKIGRIYSADIFGEETEIGALYDNDGYVNVVTMQLKELKSTVYAEKLKELYGEATEINDIASEGGATWMTWKIDGIQLRLYKEYSITSLEITKA